MNKVRKYLYIVNYFKIIHELYYRCSENEFYYRMFCDPIIELT